MPSERAYMRGPHTPQGFANFGYSPHNQRMMPRMMKDGGMGDVYRKDVNFVQTPQAGMNKYHHERGEDIRHSMTPTYQYKGGPRNQPRLHFIQENSSMDHSP